MSKLISITIASLLLIGILIQSSVSADDWVMVGHDARHTCYSTSKAPDTNKTLWIHELEEGGEIYLSAANNKVFVANEDVYALDDENGKLLWRFETEGYSVSPPAIYNGKLFATTSDDIIYSIDANSGKLIWKTSLGSWAKEAPILYENIVLAGELEGIIYALRIDNGKIIWSFESPGGHATSIYPTVTAKDGKVFNGKYALDAKTGDIIWESKVGMGPTALTENMVIVGSNGVVYALNINDGTEIWNFSLPMSDDYFSSKMRIEPIAIGYDKVFVGGTHYKIKDTLFALDVTTGQLLWNVTVRKILFEFAIADNKIFVPADKLYAFDVNNGNEIWRYDTEHTPTSPVISDDKLFFAAYDKIYAFGISHKEPKKEGKIFISGFEFITISVAIGLNVILIKKRKYYLH